MDREHEVFSANGFVVERHGRQIAIQSDGDPQAHARWADAWLSGLPAAVEERDRAMHRLDEVLRTDPAGCVALASLLYLAKDPETYRESLDDRSPAHVEFLALRALPLLAEKGSSASKRGRPDRRGPTSRPWGVRGHCADPDAAGGQR